MQPRIQIQPVWKIDLKYGVKLVASAPSARRLAIVPESPAIWVIEFGQSDVRTIPLTEPARDVGINHAGHTLAVAAASGKLSVFGLEGDSFGRELARFDNGVHETCTFSLDDTLLWTIGTVSDELAQINCYDVRSWQIIGTLQFKPFIGGCGFILTPHPQENVIGLWACGGPDEVWNYWLKLAGTVELQYQPELDGSTPPCFNRNGDRFVVLNGYDLLTYSYPDCKLMYRPLSSLDEDDPWIERMSFLDSSGDDHVLAGTNQGRIYVLSMTSGEIVGEVALERHEPKPCYQVYKALPKTDNQFCTDLTDFFSVGSNLIVSMHNNGRTSNRQDTILVWRAPVAG